MTKNENKTILFSYLKNQLKRGYSPIVLFVGKQRVGKTAMALKFAYDLNPDFDLDKDLFFEVEKFAHAVYESNQRVLVLDEAGIELDPELHQSVAQRVYSHIVQSQAYKQNIVFICLPFASEIGKAHRKHVHAVAWVVAHGVYKLYSSSSWAASMSNVPPRLMHLETISDVPLPPAHIWEKYKTSHQHAFKQKILETEIAKINAKRERDKFVKRYAKSAVAGQQ